MLLCGDELYGRPANWQTVCSLGISINLLLYLIIISIDNKFKFTNCPNEALNFYLCLKELIRPSIGKSFMDIFKVGGIYVR